MDSSLKVSSTLINTGQQYFVLPNSAIAEVLVTNELLVSDEQPPWITGYIRWDEKEIQVVTLDQFESIPSTDENSGHIILVVRNPEPNSSLLYFGIIASTIPQIVQANSTTLQKNLQPTNLNKYAKSYVLLNGRPAIIPDIGRIANLIKNVQPLGSL